MKRFCRTAGFILTWILSVKLVCCQLGCDTEPCLHGATCINLPTEPYYRCQCLVGYSGYSCQDDVDECIFESPCRNGGLCVNRFGGYDCHCGPSWDGKQCEMLVKKCAAQPCLNGATCTDVGEDFYCSCAAGYAGLHCERDINECEEVEPCSNGATCINNNGSYTCQCLPGYSGVDCESDIDECTLHSLCKNNATCKDLVNGYACLCTPGYKGLLCDEPSYECYGTPCIHGSCQRTNGSAFVCACNHGYSGDYCDFDVQECDSSPCLHGNCVDNIGGYTCFCLDGFKGDNCHIDVDECFSDPCSSGSTCVDGANGFTCLCPAGYSGVDCSEDVNECLLYSPCLNGATCIHGVGEYSCRCAKGYKGVNCSVDIDNCTDSPCVNGQCVDGVGTFHCDCLTGWQGQFCDSNIDDCSPDICHNGATCVDGLGNFTCNCPDGYAGDLCQLDIDDCYNVSCHNGSCIDKVATYRCICHRGYEGQHCELDINECTIDPRCFNGATCIDQVNNYTCQCADGYGGLYCDEIINPCLESPCRNEARCDHTGGDYHCICLPGWIGRDCETEVDECELFSPCYNNATCEDMVADYRCHCLSGYNGSRCELDIDDCMESPCHHLATCIDLVNSYQCLCSVGYAGANCDEDVDECSSSPCLNDGNCTQPSLGVYECKCVSGVTGSNCDLVNSVYINSGGQVKSPYTVSGDTLNVEFSYSALHMSGVLLWTDGWTPNHPQLLIVELHNEFVYVTMETGYGRVSLSQRIAGQTIRVVVGGDGIALSQPPQVFTEDARVTGTAEFLSSISHISLGAAFPWSASLTTTAQSGDNFHGCVGNLTLNGEMINFSNFISMNRTEFGCPVRAHCPLDYCYNNGSCTTSWDGRHHCQCTPHFTGSRCQVQLSVECVLSQLLKVPLPTASTVSLLSFVVSLRDILQSSVLVYTASGNKIALEAGAGNLTAHLLGVGYSLACSLPIPAPITLVQLQFTDYSMVLRLQDMISSSGELECSRSSVSLLEVKGDLHIGSLSPNPVQQVWRNFIGTSDGVTGCVSNLSVNGDLISFTSAISVTADQPLAPCTRDQVCSETSPCHNGGQCTGLWDTFTCTCDEMYTGNNCSEGVAVTLDGKSSALTLDLDPLIHPTVWKGSFKLRTRAKDVTVLYARYTPSFAFSLEINTEGYAELSLSTAHTEWSVVSVAGVALGQWVDIGWHVGRRTILTVNGNTQSKLWTEYQYIHVNASVKVVVGARLYTSDIDMLSDHFKGCISSLKFYSYAVNLLRPDSSRAITGNAHHIRSGCHSDVVCTGSSCPMNSYCVEGWNQFECLCSPGWQGDDCTNSTDDCLGVDCGHGYCEDLHLNHTCVCDYGYTGEGCNVELSACDVIPCWANQTAECVATPPLQFICVCLSGYHGDICNVDINECDSDPCFNGASCVDLVNGYECACTDGWAGPTCTIDIDECADQPCESSSQCVDQLIGYVCICAPGLTGANCSLDIKECAQSPCMFGSECVESEPGAFECVCPEYLTGSHCEHVRAVNFLNSTLLKLPPLPDRNAVTTIEFIFTTSLTEPRLLYAIMNEQLYQSLTVKLDHSALLLTLYAGLYSPSVSIGAPITAQQYQLITQQVLIRLLWLEGKIQLLLPPSSTVYEEDVDLGTVQLNSSVYIADITRYTPFTRILAGTSSPFIGCFSDYIVNNQPISLWTSAVLSNSLALGCGRAALCDHSSCSHAGTCTDYWSHSNCTCLPGYAGNSCDVQTFAEFSSPDSLRFSFFSNLIKVRMVIVSSPQSSGVVFYTLPESSSALALYINGSLINLVTLTLGQRLINSIELVNVSQASLCSLEVQLRSLTQTLAVRCGDVALTSAVDYKQPLEFTGPLFIGSVSLASAQQLWSDSLWSTNSITACIGQVIVNDLLLDLSQGVADVSSPIPGCTGDSNCQLSSVDCSGNGQCVVSMDTGKRCECADGFVGISCAETEPLTFDGLTSFWSLRLDLSAIAFNGSGSFAFRTRASSGTLLHLQSQSHRLQFSINSQGRLVVTTPTEEVHSLVTSLNDGSWHSVSWASSPLVVNINVSLSSKMVFSGSYGAWYDNLDVTAIVGAHPSDRASIPTDYWKGCVSSLTLGNTLIPIQSLPEGVTQTRRNVVNGCHGDVQCISADICPENAYCVEEWNSYNCSCEEGWEGPSCQTSVNDCLSHRCVNGDCIDGHKSYRCQCYHGFTGADCNEREYLCLTGQTQCSLTNTQACIDLFPLNYTCQCKLGWTGIHCTEEVNECLSNPCLNGASCVDRENLYTCTCPEEYFGKLCENKHICSSSPCNNNATCVPSDDNSLYVCKCTERYLGERCDIFNSCYLNECLHGSTCLSDSINRVYSCSCPTGYYGNRCELRDYCLDNRCQNGAECINAGNKYECVCTYHYIGEFCSTLRDKCEDNSCMNGARCTFDPQTPESSYRCVCAPGYVGEMCEMEVDECNSSPCVQGTCTDTLAGYTCSCLSGWHGNNCHLNINECSSSPCMNRGECDDGVNGYTCTCAQGYRGLHCELDYRGCRSSPCLHGATCVSQGADNSYECICVPGYAEMLCQTNIDDCVGNLCQSSSTCVDLVQDYRCDCLPGYSGQYCTDKLDSCYGSPCNNGAACSYVGLCSCEEVNEFCGFHDENCQRNRCQALAGCSLRSTSYSCDCSSTGFSGSICSIDIDECADGTHTCGTNSMCVNDAGSFHCDCEGTGYRGDNCHIDIDECSELSGRNRCNNGGTCINRPGSYSCICLDGWTGPDCTFDIQECISSPCAHNSTCIEGVNGYLCVCAGGYTGPRCLQNINECQDENICRNGGICVDIIGSYQCVCTSHWSGDHCDIQVDRITPTMTYSRATETDSATISSSTKTNTSASTLASVAGKNNHTVLTITLTLLVVILCAATVVVVLYQRRCLPQQAMKGSYRPDSMTTLPMSVQYKSDHRQVLI